VLVGVDTSAIGSSTVFVSSETGTEVVIGSGVTSSPSSATFSYVLPEYKSSISWTKSSSLASEFFHLFILAIIDFLSSEDIKLFSSRALAWSRLERISYSWASAKSWCIDGT